MAFGAWGTVKDPGANARPSMIHVFRGGNVATLDILDISGGANGTWDNAVVIGGVMPLVNTGTCGFCDSATNQGRYAYINSLAQQRSLRYDILNREVEPFCFLPVAQSTAIVGNRTAPVLFVDGAAKMTLMHMIGATQALCYRMLLHV